MKTLLAHFITFLPLVFLAASGQAQPTPVYPFYIAVTQNYAFQGTIYSVVPGEIEQVIGENGSNYILFSQKSVKFEIPKSITRVVDLAEAADGLAKGRVQAYEHYEVCLNFAQQSDILCKKLKQDQAQLIQYLNAMIQQQKNSGTSSASQQSDMLKLMQQLDELSKPTDRRRIPNENRYEVEVKQR